MNPTQILQKLAARTSWLTSKKFLAMALGIATLCASRFWPQQADFTREIAALVGTYIGIQGASDMVQNHALGKAAAAYLAPIAPPGDGLDALKSGLKDAAESAALGAVSNYASQFAAPAIAPDDDGTPSE